MTVGAEILSGTLTFCQRDGPSPRLDLSPQLIIFERLGSPIAMITRQSLARVEGESS